MACGAEDCGPYQNNLFLISSHHPLWPLNSHPFWEASCADHRLRSIMLEGEEKPWNPNPSCITWRELFGGVCRGVCFKIWGGGRPRTQLWCWRLSRSCWWPSWYDGTRVHAGPRDSPVLGWQQGEGTQRQRYLATVSSSWSSEHFF